MSPPGRPRIAVIVLWVVVVAALALVPTMARRDDIINFAFITLLFITLAHSWNILGGYAGQVNLGFQPQHAMAWRVDAWL